MPLKDYTLLPIKHFWTHLKFHVAFFPSSNQKTHHCRRISTPKWFSKPNNFIKVVMNGTISIFSLTGNDRNYRRKRLFSNHSLKCRHHMKSSFNNMYSVKHKLNHHWTYKITIIIHQHWEDVLVMIKENPLELIKRVCCLTECTKNMVFLYTASSASPILYK